MNKKRSQSTNLNIKNFYKIKLGKQKVKANSARAK